MDQGQGQRIRVGIIGLGEVAQVVHLPVLESLSDRFAVTAICDVSPTLLAAMGERVGLPPEARHEDYRDLVARDDLDAVWVLNSDEYHADCTIAALEHGKHVLVEKPMCLTEREAESIIRARDAAGCVVMVGYMRRYAPAFVQAVDRVRELGPIRHVRVRDIIGRNQIIIDQATHVLRPADIPAHQRQDRAARAARLVKEAIGDAPEPLGRCYRLLCGLSSHDLSAMRELVGFPQRVVAASSWHGGNTISAIFDFGDFGGVFETGVDEQARFDAHIEVYGSTASVRVQYDTPYIRHLPTTMIVTETDGPEYRVSETRPTFADPYTREVEAFHRAIVEEVPVKTTPEDFVEDLRLFSLIIAALNM